LTVAADGGDRSEDVEYSSVAATNGILLSLMTDRLKNIHDIELPLCDHDVAHIAKLLCVRNSNHGSPPSAPTKLRCYVRVLASSHLVLTVVPATYDDMVAVMTMLDAANSTVDSAANDGMNTEAVCEAVDSGKTPADQDSSLPRNVDGDSDGLMQANDTSTQSAEVVPPDRQTTSHRHDVCFPVFVFDCLWNVVSDQIVHHSSTDRPTDIIEDFTRQVTTTLSQVIYCL